MGAGHSSLWQGGRILNAMLHHTALTIEAGKYIIHSRVAKSNPVISF